jgi:hypothetical protein
VKKITKAKKEGGGIMESLPNEHEALSSKKQFCQKEI